MEKMDLFLFSYILMFSMSTLYVLYRMWDKSKSLLLFYLLSLLLQVLFLNVWLFQQNVWCEGFACPIILVMGCILLVLKYKVGSW
uniref:Uncharacterized protein n=1 Tax=Dreissena rostriformis TaxID=205083 RepID=A0A894JFL5_9BIVA|nr:hypothetical protein K8L31_mgp16 [Dreissena rostriformis]QRV59726.1 hypothetical protein [Dreissena rostriformis]